MSIESMMPSNYLILCRPLLPLLLLCFWLKSIIASCKLLHQLLLIVAYISMTEGKLILHLHCTFPKALSIANSVLTNYKYPSPQSMTERPKDVCFPPFSLKGSCHLTKLNFPFILCGWVYLISLQAHKSCIQLLPVWLLRAALSFPQPSGKVWDQPGTESTYAELCQFPLPSFYFLTTRKLIPRLIQTWII